MAVKLAPLASALPQFFDSQGNVLSGGKVHVYTAGTTTNITTYTDSTGNTSNSNPITLDSAGRLPNECWITDGVTFKVVVKDSSGNTIKTVDNLKTINDVSSVQDQWAASGLTPTYISASSFSVIGDQTTTLHVGRRLKIVDGGGTKYAAITGSAFSTVTTVTVAVDAGGSLSSPVTAVSYGVVSATDTSTPLPIIGQHDGVVIATQVFS